MVDDPSQRPDGSDDLAEDVDESDDPAERPDGSDTRSSPSIPPSGTTLLLGPSNVGKTTHTARALERWVETHGGTGVVVLDFGPEVERDGAVLGGRLDRFTDLLAAETGGEHEAGTDRTAVRRVDGGIWYGLVDAHAPRAASADESAAVALAAENAMAAARLLERAPQDPRAVFVNDATIALQHPTGDADRLLAYCADADAAVLNAFESDELGTEDPVSRQERAALDTLSAGADRIVRLP